VPEQNAGGFRHLVTLERPARTVNERGISEPGWEPVGSYRAAKRGLTGREFFDAAAAKQQDIVIFYLRTGIEADASMRLVYKGKPHDIYSVREVDADGAARQEIRARLTEVRK